MLVRVCSRSPAAGLARGHGHVVPAVPLAMGHGHPKHEPVPLPVQAHRARDHVPVQGQRAVLPVEGGAGHPAPGRQTRGDGVRVRCAQVEPEGTAQEQPAEREGLANIQRPALPQAWVRLIRPWGILRAPRPRADPQHPRHFGQYCRRGRGLGRGRPRRRPGLSGPRAQRGGLRGRLPQRDPVAAHRQVRGLVARPPQPVRDRVRHVRGRGAPEPRQPRPLHRVGVPDQPLPLAVPGRQRRPVRGSRTAAGSTPSPRRSHRRGGGTDTMFTVWPAAKVSVPVVAV